VNSYISNEFIELFNKLPESVQKQAKKSFKIWKKNPNHPSLQYKKIHNDKQIWSVRISLKWRILGLRKMDDIYWFWIGSHSDYEKLIKKI
jgi:mRNA-degrading endonuclease RelE of RelBE toxin-antitoxin system